MATACTQGKRAQHGKPLGVVRDDQPDAGDGQAGRPGVAERSVVPGKPGNAGGGKGPQFKTDVIRSEGVEIGQPINSVQCSETADGVTRESEVRSRLSLLRPVRQDLPGRHPGPCLCPVPLQQGRTRRGWPGLCRGRSVRGAAMAGRTGASTQRGKLPTGPDPESVHPESQWQATATGHLNPAGSGEHDSSDAGARTDL